MTKTKHRVLSVLLTLCLTVALCAGFMVAAPVEVKAAGYDYTNLYVGQILYLNDTIYYNVDKGGGSLNFYVYASFEDYQSGKHYGGVNNRTGPLDWVLIEVLVPTRAQCVYIVELTTPPNNPDSRDIHLVDRSLPEPEPAPIPHGTRPTEPMAARHYDFWLPVYTQLMAMGNSGSVTVDTAGADIIYVKYFVFEALKGTNRTLVVKHAGATYRINGRSMAGITLGQNHLFVGNLDGYRV